ncbi:hypothetical protein G7Y89_g11719 [Cudoniella acicularis]|uniref:ABM domain-containing protein n=1 Tax=Cudoniella acicularis TaxID=354080 RepID=A0A8H4RD71_9HELO|nr:hypothetical protein G7Y89_g11719 [Cudoniella acicularis]
MASQLDIIAIISPKPGKTDRVVELLQGVSEYVKKNEPGTLKYEITRSMNKKAGVEEVVMLETYKDKVALDIHGRSEAFGIFQKTLKEEGLVGAPMQLKITKAAGGFASRLTFYNCLVTLSETHLVTYHLKTSYGLAENKLLTYQEMESPSEYFSARHSVDGSGPSVHDDYFRTTLSTAPITEQLHTPITSRTSHIRESSCSSSPKLIQIITTSEVCETPEAFSDASPSSQKLSPPSIARRRAHRRSFMKGGVVSMAYNEYGELVDADKLRKKQNSVDLTVVELLRVIIKAYHHDSRNKMCDVMLEEMSDFSFLLNDGTFKWQPNLSSWIFQYPSTKDLEPTSTPDLPLFPVSRNPPRVLELGCGDGIWCLRAKNENPSWVVHGLDDSNHWLCVHEDLNLKDFMISEVPCKAEDYFGCVKVTESHPEFTVRNLNQILYHQNPLPTDYYGLVRGRDVFDRVESYISFLDAVRLVLQPEGVVEFIELDPRPRIELVGPTIPPESSYKTTACTNWSNKIVDRFEESVDMELATTAPKWSARVNEHLKAGLRPKDGIPATNLKYWLQTAGFYDVKQVILRLPIGGKTTTGQKLKNVILWQMELENAIPKLKAELPAAEVNEIESGLYYLNLHIVTGRKPPKPRTGDLLADGARQEMSPSTYDTMARLNDTKSGNWKRFDSNKEANIILKSFTTLRGVPGEIPEDKAFCGAMKLEL